MIEHLFSREDVEQAAYVFCRLAKMPSELVLLVRKIVPVAQEDIVEASKYGMKISARSYTRAMKEANERKECFFFVHSHPDGVPKHSVQDDSEETMLFRTAYIRIKTPGVHGSLVCAERKITSALVYLENGQTVAVDRIRIVGKHFRYWFSQTKHTAIPDFFDRQVRAFGPDIQELLSRLHVGVVGAGGTGSCVAEQLIRLGVGRISVADGESFERSNINRIYGSRVVDDGLQKVKLIERLAADVGLGTAVTPIPRPITYRSVLMQFRDCDVIFACTDDEWGRSLLTRFAIYYCIPVIDMGVRIDSEQQSIRSIQGRVTMLLPGTACLYCRGRISAQRISAEVKWALNPKEAEELKREGYIPELGEPSPAVIPFTSVVASSAVGELLHRLTGFLGNDRESSEVLHLVDHTEIRRNHRSRQDDCFCNDDYYRARGDVEPFLDVTWRPE
jgi:hypothetical protein